MKNNYFIENLNYLTHNTNINVKELGNRLGISRQAIRSYIIGKSEPTIENLIKICEIYDITPTQLLIKEIYK